VRQGAQSVDGSDELLSARGSNLQRAVFNLDDIGINDDLGGGLILAWWTQTHVDVTARILGGGLNGYPMDPVERGGRLFGGPLSADDLAIVEAGQRYIDDINGPFQDSASSFMHAMTGRAPNPNDPRWNTNGPSDIDMTVRIAGERTLGIFRSMYPEGQDPLRPDQVGQLMNRDDARNLSNAWVQANFELAQQALDGDGDGSGGRELALRHFSYALHTMQDNTSPTHWGFQVWDPHWWNLPAQGMHALGENFDPGPGSNMYRATRDAYNWFFRDRALPRGDVFRGYGFDRRPQTQPNPNPQPAVPGVPI